MLVTYTLSAEKAKTGCLLVMVLMMVNCGRTRSQAKLCTYMMKLSIVVLLLAGSLGASPLKVKRIDLPASQNPTNADIPVAGAVWAGDTLYVSGWLDPDRKKNTDTASQTVSLIKDIQQFLGTQKLSLGDVVMMHVYLGGDPAKGGKMDVAGMMAGYTQFFGTKDQPNKPARTTVQVVLPAAASGGLIEIDLVAVRSR